jgi:hypothetical protein
MLTTIKYFDDGKQKLSSWEASIDTDLDTPGIVGYGNLNVTCYGETKQEAYKNLVTVMKYTSDIMLQFEGMNDEIDDRNEEW